MIIFLTRSLGVYTGGTWEEMRGDEKQRIIDMSRRRDIMSL